MVGGYLGTAGLNLDAVVFDAAGNPQTRIGRFVPAGFALSSPTVSHRWGRSCSVASTFTYLDEDFQLGFTLEAKNAVGMTTANYFGSFARLDLSAPANFRLAGIGGSTAKAVGELLQQLGERGQVLCVTHQAQVAAQAHHHLLVSKSTSKQQTTTALTALGKQERIREIARMLSGERLSDTTLAHAREMLQPPKKAKTA